MTTMTQEIIKATNETIHDIVKQEIERLGNDADLNHIDASNLTNMEYLFRYSQFNGDISQWDVSNVESMKGMFTGAWFNGDISQCAVSSVQDMSWMFHRSDFNGDISKWDVNKVEDMKHMFDKAAFNGNISNWDVSNVVESMTAMFKNSEFNGDISQWDVSNVEFMTDMFKGSQCEEKYGEHGENLKKVAELEEEQNDSMNAEAAKEFDVATFEVEFEVDTDETQFYKRGQARDDGNLNITLKITNQKTDVSEEVECWGTVTIYPYDGQVELSEDFFSKLEGKIPAGQIQAVCAEVKEYLEDPENHFFQDIDA